MLFNKKTVRTTIGATLCVLVTACSNDSSNSGIPYTGKTTPAAITETNASTISVDSMNGASTTGVDKLFGVVTDAAPSNASTVGIAKILAHRVAALHADSNARTPVLSGATQADTITGSCGGTATISGSQTTVTMSFNKFCDTADFDTSGLTFNGSVSVAVQGDVSGTDPFTMTMSIGSLTAKGTVAGETVDVAMSGTLAMEMAPAGDMTLKMSFVAVDYVTGEQAKTENLVLAMTSTGVSMDGRVYLSQEGYVDIVTVTPINTTLLNSTPSAGEISFTGANSAKAVLKITGSGTYQVTFNGNVVDSGNWADLGVESL